jgi:ketosteroid isomerase-like protein
MTPSAAVADAVLPEQPISDPDPTALLGPLGRKGSVGPMASPEELCHGFAAAVAAGDLDAVVELYAADAVVTLPRCREAAGHVAIRAAFEAALHRGLDLGVVSVGRPIVTGSLACTTTTDSAGRVHTQVARREADGSWRWIRDGSRLREGADQEPVAAL